RERPAARNGGHWPIPPPMPLSSAGSWNSRGNQSSSASNFSNDGPSASQASCGEPAAATCSRTCATNERTCSVSSTYSSCSSGGRPEAESHIREVPEGGGHPERGPGGEEGRPHHGQPPCPRGLAGAEPQLAAAPAHH